MSATVRRAAALAAAALVALVALVTGASADTSKGRIVQITSKNGQIQVIFSATGLPAGSSVDLNSVTMTVNGEAVQARAVPLSQSAAFGVSQTTVLAIDVSGSMVGAGIAGAKAAALKFLSSVPGDVRVGLVTFSDTPHLVVAPTNDRAALSKAISGLQAKGETALYDGVILAVKEAGTSGSRTVVVLSDGGDTRSHAKLANAVNAISKSRDILDAVSLETSESQPAVLAQLAVAGAGHVIATAQAAGLASAFTTAARDVSNQILVTAPIPASAAGHSATVSVTATAAGSSITDSVFAPLASISHAGPVTYGPKTVHVHSGSFQSKTALWIAVAGLFVGLAVMLGVGFNAVRSASGGMRRRLSLYTLTGRTTQEPQHDATVLGDSSVARSAVEFAGRVVAKRGLDAQLEQRLDAAGVPLKPAEWLLIHAGAMVALSLLLVLVTGGRILPGLIGLAIGALVPLAYLTIKETRRTSAFLAALPDTLQLIAGGLVAGYSLPQALDTVVRESSEPMASEINRALVEARLGVPIEDALEGVATRMRSKDFSWVVMAIRIQREVGGNLAEVLTNVAGTLRERERLRRQVKVLSAEGRLSAYILFGLPVVFGLYLALVRPNYIKPLYHDALGIVMLVFLGIELTVGALWLRKVVQVEV